MKKLEHRSQENLFAEMNCSQPNYVATDFSDPLFKIGRNIATLKSKTNSNWGKFSFLVSMVFMFALSYSPVTGAAPVPTAIIKEGVKAIGKIIGSHADEVGSAVSKTKNVKTIKSLEEGVDGLINLNLIKKSNGLGIPRDSNGRYLFIDSLLLQKNAEITAQRAMKFVNRDEIVIGLRDGKGKFQMLENLSEDNQSILKQHSVDSATKTLGNALAKARKTSKTRPVTLENIKNKLPRLIEKSDKNYELTVQFKIPKKEAKKLDLDKSIKPSRKSSDKTLEAQMNIKEVLNNLELDGW